MEYFEKHDLPSGAWIAFHDPKQLTRKQRKPIERAQTRIGIAKSLQNAVRGEGSAASVTDEDIDLLDGLMEACAVTLIAEWSYPLPITVESLEDPLVDNDYEALIGKIQAHRSVLMPDFDPGPREDGAGNENPTGPSDVSELTSEDSQPPDISPTNSEPGTS